MSDFRGRSIVRFSVAEKVFAVLLMVMFISMPILAQSGQDDYLRGKMQGEADVKATNLLWFFGGCFVIGLFLAYTVEPTVPSAALMGKSPDYIRGYTDGYQAKAKKEQFMKAVYGCITSIVCCCALMFVPVPSG